MGGVNGNTYLCWLLKVLVDFAVTLLFNDFLCEEVMNSYMIDIFVVTVECL